MTGPTTAGVGQPVIVTGEPPKDGEIYQAWLSVPVRWKAYSPKSEQFRHGIKGRWQQMNEFGGWENADHCGRHWGFAGYFPNTETSNAG